MMGPFSRLVVDEIRRNLRTPWLLAGFGLLAIAGLSVLQLGSRELAEQKATYAELAQTRVQAQLTRQWASGRLPEPGLRVIRHPSWGAVFVRGLDWSLPAAWEFAPAGTEALFSYSRDQSQFGRGGWDVGLLARILAGLLAFGLGVRNVLADRASMWLRVLQTLPGRPSVASAAGVCGGCLSLTALLVAWWTIMSAGSAFVESPEALGWRLWALGVPALLSSWLFYGLGMACAWAIRLESQAIALGFTVWLTLAILAPALVNGAAELIAPAAPRIRMERERREQYADAMQTAEQTLARQLSERLSVDVAAAQAEHEADILFPELDSEWQRLSQAARQAARELEADWRAQVHVQERLAFWAAWMSPVTLVQSALAELAGTGQSENETWEKAVGGYRLALDAALFDNLPRVGLRVRVGAEMPMMSFDRRPLPRFSDLPQFDPPSRSLSVRFRSASTYLIGIMAWTLTALGAAWAFGTRALRTE